MAPDPGFVPGRVELDRAPLENLVAHPVAGGHPSPAEVGSNP
jgi:hypothetical protein